MSAWCKKPFTQFACGVVFGAGAVALLSFIKRVWKLNHSKLPEVGTPSCRVFKDSSTLIVSNESQMSHIGEYPLDKNEKLVDFFYIAKDEAQRNGFVHRGITCNMCSVSPICGTRYKCANCLDYDLCEVCEPKEYHDRTHVFIKINYPVPPLANPKTICIKPLYTGKIASHSVSLSWNEVTALRDQTHFDETEIHYLFEQFKALAPHEDGITREAFDRCLGPLGKQTNLVIDRMFSFYDADKNGIISFNEFVTALSVLTRGGKNEKVRYVFEGYDVKNKGYLLPKDFRDIFKAYFLISVEMVRDYIKICEEEMKASFDKAADKSISSVFNGPIPDDALCNAASNDIKSRKAMCSHEATKAKPIMETMSHDALDEMVANVFKCADLNKDGKITYDEFKIWAALDNTVLAWFDVIGTVF